MRDKSTKLFVRCYVTTFGCSQITEQPDLRFRALLTEGPPKVKLQLI
jgi:hypothetical protein